MAESLQRSEISFRRQGSSGLVWDDKQLLNGEFLAATAGEKPENTAEKVGPAGSDAGAAEARPYKTVKVPSPAADPPSPKVAGCGICGMFAKPAHQGKRNNNRPR